MAGDNPEIQFIKGNYNAAFKEAFEEAIRRLEPRDKNLLRQHMIDKLSIDEIGSLYQVHRATAARWVANARSQLLTEFSEIFMKRTKIGKAEFQSLLKDVKSRLDLSLHRVL